MNRFILLAALVGFAASTSGCVKTSCNENDPETVPFANEQGITEGNVFYSGDIDGPYLFYPPGRTYVFEHDLGANPIPYSYVAFSEKGNLATAAGDMAVYHPIEGEKNRDQHFSVLNNTCSTFWLWQVLTVPVSQTTPDPQGEAGAAGASAE
jgi:hypothetical protein